MLRLFHSAKLNKQMLKKDKIISILTCSGQLDFHGVAEPMLYSEQQDDHIFIK